MTAEGVRAILGHGRDSKARRQSITRELTTWAREMPRLIERADEVAALPRLTDIQTVYIESIPERLEGLLQAIHAAVDTDESYDCLTGSMDQLREEIKIANATLDLMLAPV
jgi:hypothetical protein